MKSEKSMYPKTKNCIKQYHLAKQIGVQGSICNDNHRNVRQQIKRGRSIDNGIDRTYLRERLERLREPELLAARSNRSMVALLKMLCLSINGTHLSMLLDLSFSLWR